MSDNTRLVGLKKDKNEDLYKELFVTDSKYRLISSSPKVFSAIHPEDFNEDFYISEDELSSYVDGFIQAVTDNSKKIIESITQNTNNNSIEDNMSSDPDVKLSLYRSFKSFYDKWVSNSYDSVNKSSGYFFNNYGEEDNRMLYEHFKFINRANQDVGKKAVIDFSYLSNLASTKNGQGPTQSLYESLTSLLSKNNFDFWPLPANIDLSTVSLTNEQVKDIFRPLTFIDKVHPGPSFVCVHIGGSSRSLADLKDNSNTCSVNGGNFEYVDDSFDITNTVDLPVEYTKEGEGLVVFKVRYGQEAQNHFNSIELDQTEFKETQESLQIIDALTNPNSGSNPSQIGKGNNMYDVYLTRAYNCTVSGLGNMSIQPLMYFKLENVPMFRGTYLINAVSHTITNNKITTEFTGMRQPKVTIPVVTEALSLIDLALVEVVQTDTTTTNINGNGSTTDSGDYSGGDISVFNSVDTNAKGCEIIGRLKGDLGINDVQAAGIIGNLIAESGLIPDRIQGSGEKKGLITESGGWNGTAFTGGLGYGWAQWTFYTLKNDFIEYASTKGLDLKTKPATDEISYGYLIYWLTVSEGGKKLTEFKNTATVYDAAKYVAQKWERCANCQKESEWKKRSAFAQNVFDSCGKTPTGGGGTGKPPEPKNCSSSVKFGLNGGGTLANAKNAIVGSSSVGTLNGMSKSSTYGNLTSNNIYVYYNCGGKTLSWLKQQINGDGNVYASVESFFQVGIGTNDGYPTKDSTKKDIKSYTDLVRKKFPNATVYILPGTRGWGSVSSITLSQMKSYYKQYTDLGWTLLWPLNSSSNEIDPYFDTQTKAHNSNDEWFKKQMKRIKDNKS